MTINSLELKHKYGEQYHIVSNLFLSSLLAELCSPKTKQPFLTDIVKILYHHLLSRVISQEFPSRKNKVQTRMFAHHKEAVVSDTMIDFRTKVVAVDLARAAIVPSQLCYELLNRFFIPAQVRQDHIYIQRMVDKTGRVIKSHVGGYKIGGSIQDAIVLVPDPMGATGGSICEAMDLYQSKISGKARKWVALHLIVTPEYLKRVKEEYPELIVYALRLDRGLSPSKVLHSQPGTYWEKEKGLNQHQYIVPGAGGLGELLNNSFV